MPGNGTGVDYYALLGVGREARAEDIHTAWRELVLKHHPDKQLGRAGQTCTPAADVDIRLVNEARWVLSDDERRQEWESAFFEGMLAFRR